MYSMKINVLCLHTNTVDYKMIVRNQKDHPHSINIQDTHL